MKTFVSAMILVFGITAIAPVSAQMTIPHTFSAGSPAVAQEVNENFTAVQTHLNNQFPTVDMSLYIPVAGLRNYLTISNMYASPPTIYTKAWDGTTESYLYSNGNRFERVYSPGPDGFYITEERDYDGSVLIRTANFDPPLPSMMSTINRPVGVTWGGASIITITYPACTNNSASWKITANITGDGNCGSWSPPSETHYVLAQSDCSYFNLSSYDGSDYLWASSDNNISGNQYTFTFTYYDYSTPNYTKFSSLGNVFLTITGGTLSGSYDWEHTDSGNVQICTGTTTMTGTIEVNLNKSFKRATYSVLGKEDISVSGITYIGITSSWVRLRS